MQLDNDSLARWRKIRPLHWAIFGGLVLGFAPAILFSLRTEIPGVPVLSALIFVVLFTGGIAGVSLAVATAVVERQQRVAVLNVIAYFFLVSLGFLILVLNPDPIPFIATLTSALASVMVSWILTERAKLFKLASETESPAGNGPSADADRTASPSESSLDEPQQPDHSGGASADDEQVPKE